MVTKGERKRRSRSPSSDEAKSRQKGRPRKGDTSQTAGDRRRTQIRLAQRAYRQRKETTIAELSEKVTDLEQTIYEMNSTFVALQKRAASSTLQSVEPDLAQSLQTIANRFSTLIPGSETVPNERLVEQAERAQVVPQALQYQDDSTYSTGNKTKDLAAEAIYETSKASQILTSSTSLPVANILNATPAANERGGDHGFTETASRGQTPAEIPARSEELVDFPVTIDAQHNLLPLSAWQLAPPSTYSFKESTFGRRLMRAAYERALGVMTDPRKVMIKNEMCKFAFCFSNTANITNWIRKVVRATTKDSLELWVAPQLHIGNAGLRYPRTSLDGANLPPSFWADKAPMGPRRAVLAETPVPNSMTVSEIIEMMGFSGDWYDPNDVEHYLTSKGLVLSEQSSLVELKENAVPLLEAPNMAAVASPMSSGPGTAPPSPDHANIQIVEGSDMEATKYAWGDVGFPSHHTASFDKGDENEYVSTIPRRRDPRPNVSLSVFNITDSSSNSRTRKILDVDKFVGSKYRLSSATWPLSLNLDAAIIHEAYCLGRSPGWRRSSIDSALAVSTLRVY